jgi:hypothetical protein
MMKQETKLENGEPLYPQYINTYDHQDEINLVDLWIALLKHKKPFLLLFTFSIIVGVIVVNVNTAATEAATPKAATKAATPKYTLSTIIDVASNRGDVIESPAAVITRINTLILPKSTRKVMLSNNLPFFNTIVVNPADTTLVMIKNEIMKKDMPIFSQFQLEVGNQVVSAHAVFTNKLNSELLTHIAAVEALVSQELKLATHYRTEGNNKKTDDFYRFMDNIQQSRANILTLKSQLKTGLTQISRAELALWPTSVDQPTPVNQSMPVNPYSKSNVYIIVVLISFFLSLMFVLVLMFRAKVIERLAEKAKQ